MTRLTTSDIDAIAQKLADYDTDLIEKTGRTLLGIACYANGCEKIDAQRCMTAVRFAMVTMTCGEGIISGFVETVRQIAGHIGVPTSMTQSTDAAGIAEAIEDGATHVMMADDHRFVVLDLIDRRVSDNSTATARGFTAGLDLMVPGGLGGKNVLIVGCGLVGKAAARKALALKAKVTLCDRNRVRCIGFAQRLWHDFGQKVSVTDDLRSALNDYSLMIEASNASDIINADVIHQDTYIAAPGMPIGLTASALEVIGQRLLHDPLQIGVATMVVGALNAQSELK